MHAYIRPASYRTRRLEEETFYSGWKATTSFSPPDCKNGDSDEGQPVGKEHSSPNRLLKRRPFLTDGLFRAKESPHFGGLLLSPPAHCGQDTTCHNSEKGRPPPSPSRYRAWLKSRVGYAAFRRSVSKAVKLSTQQNKILVARVIPAMVIRVWAREEAGDLSPCRAKAVSKVASTGHPFTITLLAER